MDEQKIAAAMQAYKKHVQSMDNEQLLKEIVIKYSESCQGWSRQKLIVEQEWQTAKEEALRRMK